MGNMSEKKESVNTDENKIDNIRKKCKALENEDEPDKIRERIEYYEELFEYNNTEEDDIFQYMLSFQKLLNKNEILENEFVAKLEIYKKGISDDKYSIYFKKYPRENSMRKIYNLLELLCSDLDADIFYYKRKTFIVNIGDLSSDDETSKFIFKGKVSWNNKELYLYNLYSTLLSSINKKIDVAKKTKVKDIENIPIYAYYQEKLKTVNVTEKDKIKSLMENVNLCEGKLFNTYIKYFKIFLIEVKDNFNEKFENNNLDNIKDKLLYEDFIQFLCSHNFQRKELNLINLWNQAFVPMKFEDKINKISLYHALIQSPNNKMKYELTKNNTLNQIYDGKIINSINNIDKYDFASLLHDLTIDDSPEHYEFYLNKNLIPSEYETELFVKKKWIFWRQILISILSSQTMIENIKLVFNNQGNIDFLKDQIYLSKLLDNIRFFIYEADLAGSLNESSLRIYEYGLFMKDDNKSISLLFFYSFNVVTNIHEISGHYYVRFEKLINPKKENILDSPNIDVNKEYLFSSYALNRKKESGESIEISLFGKRIRSLTVKEALYILNTDNYSVGVDKFKKGFMKCNSLKKEDIISKHCEYLLKELGIDLVDLPDDSDKAYPISRMVNMDSSKTTFDKEVIHPPEFYCEKIDLKETINYLDIITKDCEKLNKK